MSPRSASWGRRAYYGINGFILVFLLGPLLVVAVFSLNPTPYIQFPPVGVTLHWYEKFFASYEFMNSLWLSLRVAAAVVVLSSFIGACAALALARGSLPGTRFLAALFLAPLMLPAILTGLALFQLTEMGPVRSLKTIVRAFVIDVECGQIGSILVNEVTACAPGNPNGCLDGLTLSSRLKELRFYK
jgi:ABC-type spermidine/putrescine transport system permease subunit II